MPAFSGSRMMNEIHVFETPAVGHLSTRLTSQKNWAAWFGLIIMASFFFFHFVSILSWS
jgi:hypothetical protein